MAVKYEWITVELLELILQHQDNIWEEKINSMETKKAQKENK